MLEINDIKVSFWFMYISSQDTQVLLIQTNNNLSTISIILNQLYKLLTKLTLILN